MGRGAVEPQPREPVMLSRPTHYRIVAATEGCNVEFHVLHSQVGPPGTPGRGPYCISWMPILTSQVPEVIARLSVEGIQELEPDA